MYPPRVLLIFLPKVTFDNFIHETKVPDLELDHVGQGYFTHMKRFAVGSDVKARLASLIPIQLSSVEIFLLSACKLTHFAELLDSSPQVS